MDLRYFEAISEANDGHSLFIALERFAHQLDFERFSLVASFPASAPGAKPIHKVVANPPEAFITPSRDYELTRRDPVFMHLSTSTRPVVYDQALYISTDNSDLWEVVASHGYVAGIAAAAAFGNRGPRLMFGLDRGTRLPTEATRTAYFISQISTALIYAQGQVDNLFYETGSSSSELTDQQWQILLYIAEGKTDSVIAQLIGISPHTVNYHVRRIFTALRISNRAQAIKFANSMSAALKSHSG